MTPIGGRVCACSCAGTCGQMCLYCEYYFTEIYKFFSIMVHHCFAFGCANHDIKEMRQEGIKFTRYENVIIH
jgi:hypothetical protein